MKLNLSKPSCKWTTISEILFFVQFVADEVKDRLRKKHNLEGVIVDGDLQIDEKSVEGKEEQLKKYFIDLLDYCLLDWKEVSLDGENIAVCNKANKTTLFKNHYALSLMIISYACSWPNFASGLGETLKNSERPSHTDSNGNGVKDSTQVAISV